MGALFGVTCTTLTKTDIEAVEENDMASCSVEFVLW